MNKSVRVKCHRSLKKKKAREKAVRCPNPRSNERRKNTHTHTHISWWPENHYEHQVLDRHFQGLLLPGWGSRRWISWNILLQALCWIFTNTRICSNIPNVLAPWCHCNSSLLENKHSEHIQNASGRRPCGMTQQNFYSFHSPESDNGLIFALSSFILI